MLGLIKRNFQCMSKRCLIILFKALVRSHLEYANNVWSPIRNGEADDLEKVQKRFTKMFKKLAHLPYPERLRELKLPTLKYRRIRGDMIQVYKIITGKYDSNCVTGLFQMHKDANTGAVHETRGHRYKLTQTQCKFKVTQHFFVNRSVPIWNCLPDNVVAAENTNTFKSRLDRFWSNQDFLYVHKADPGGTGSCSKV